MFNRRNDNNYIKIKTKILLLNTQYNNNKKRTNSF